MKKVAMGREVRLAIVLLVALIIAVGVSTVISQNVIGDLIESTEALYTDDGCIRSEGDVKKIYDKFEKWRFFFNITINHNDIGYAESDLLELIEAIRANDSTAAGIAKSRLVGALKQLKRLSGVNSDSII